MPTDSAAASSRSLRGRLTTAPRVITGPLPRPCSPSSPASTPGASVAWVTSTAMHRSGSSPNAIARAPCEPISSMVAATAATGPVPPPASLTRRATSERDVDAEPVVERARDEPVVAQLQRLGRDHDRVALAHELARLLAVAHADVHVQALQLDGLLALVALEHVDRLAPDDAGHRSAAREDLDALADQHLRVPAARPDHVQVAPVVDVADQQADLVDVADDGQQRVLARAVHARDRGADGVERDLVGETPGGLAPDGGGSLLVAGRPGSGQQALE